MPSSHRPRQGPFVTLSLCQRVGVRRGGLRCTAVARVHDHGAAYAGSQLQTQLYVNRRTDALDGAIRNEFRELNGAALEWRSPLASDNYCEYWDRAFLERVDLGHHAADLKAFWPTGGPHWDALAVAHRPDDTRPGVLLVEGKSYPDEFYGSGCAAQPGSMSRQLIEKSLGRTQQRIGVTGRTPADWCGPLYQSANRLAHLYWLRSLGVRAWLVHLLFTDDPHGPTNAQQWAEAVRKTNDELGVTGKRVEGAGHVVLAAGTREELLGS
jgi:hypothetical protein